MYYIVICKIGQRFIVLWTDQSCCFWQAGSANMFHVVVGPVESIHIQPVTDRELSDWLSTWPNQWFCKGGNIITEPGRVQCRHLIGRLILLMLTVWLNSTRSARLTLHILTRSTSPWGDLQILLGFIINQEDVLTLDFPAAGESGEGQAVKRPAVTVSSRCSRLLPSSIIFCSPWAKKWAVCIFFFSLFLMCFGFSSSSQPAGEVSGPLSF